MVRLQRYVVVLYYGSVRSGRGWVREVDKQIRVSVAGRSTPGTDTLLLNRGNREINLSFMICKVILDSVVSLRAGLGEACLGSFQGELTSSHPGTACGEPRRRMTAARGRRGKKNG